jgi:DMSO reductase anchor subunit
VNPPSEGRRELDSVVINIELTLVSIIQGVALFFLTDNARALMSMRHWAAFLYVAAGLGVIFIFWSRSVIHTLTLIRWPLEFGHNFFYITCALGEAILFTRLDDPLAWFQLSAAFAGIVWLLFIYDMRLIRARIVESSDDSEHALYARARSDQLLNIRLLIPALIVLNLVSTFAIWCWPDLFIARARHVWLIGVQLLCFFGYLFYTTRYFSAIAPLVLRNRRTD